MKKLLSFLAIVCCIALLPATKVFAHAELYELLTLAGTSTATGTSTITTDTSWDRYSYVEGIYRNQGVYDARFMIAGTPTATAGMVLSAGDVLKLHTLYDMKNLVLVCGTTTQTTYIGVVYSRSQQDTNGIEIEK